MNQNNINNYEDPQVEKVKYTNILLVLVIGIFIVIKLYSHQIQIKDFFKLNISSINYEVIYELKGYIILFIIIIPLSYFLWKSNIKWAQEQIEIMEQKEEEKKKLKQEQRKEEFENKMRGIHFKDD